MEWRHCLESTQLAAERGFLDTLTSADLLPPNPWKGQRVKALLHDMLPSLVARENWAWNCRYDLCYPE